MRLPVLVVLSCSAAFALAACAGREDVKSGYVGTATMNEDQVTQLLLQQNYTDITGLHENGRDWVGEAQKAGQAVSFDIAPNGTIHTK
jgi:hypothetical protein